MSGRARLPWAALLKGYHGTCEVRPPRLGPDVGRGRGFPGGAVVENLPATARDVSDTGSTPGSGRSPAEGNS